MERLELDIEALQSAVTAEGIKAALAWIRQYCSSECPLVAAFCNNRCEVPAIKAALRRRLAEKGC